MVIKTKVLRRDFVGVSRHCRPAYCSQPCSHLPPGSSRGTFLPQNVLVSMLVYSRYVSTHLSYFLYFKYILIYSARSEEQQVFSGSQQVS